MPLLIIDDLGRRKLLTSNRPVEDWGKLLGYAAVTTMLDRLLHHGHVLKWSPKPENETRHTNGISVSSDLGFALPTIVPPSKMDDAQWHVSDQRLSSN